MILFKTIIMYFQKYIKLVQFFKIQLNDHLIKTKLS